MATAQRIKVQCEECQAVFEIQINEFEFECVDSDERDMGPELTYSGTVEIECENCGSLIEVTHIFWEYPEGFVNHKETNVSGAEVIENTL
ncbi:hypothetical protein LX59_03049 [Azomonas agilis]|uniref:Uncharacterized protein n=1 Tax=Azomonas agilis TaxID=116849 RepID=A0A562HZS0_9GAMM|nr:hypothetical protein [Azomonas agilis]TWH63885.1 hypothetical protein LX59_03049 [Azomonas agilis]